MNYLTLKEVSTIPGLEQGLSDGMSAAVPIML